GGAAVPRSLADMSLEFLPLQAKASATRLPAGDVLGQAGDGTESGKPNRAALACREPVDAPNRLNMRLHHAAAARIESGPRHAEGDSQAQQLHVASPCYIQKMKARTCRDVRAPDQRQLTGSAAAQGEGKIERVQHQPGSAGGADIEAVIARGHRTRLEGQVAAAARRAAELGLANLGGGLHAHQVLRVQPRLGTAGADVVESEWTAGE